VCLSVGYPHFFVGSGNELAALAGSVFFGFASGQNCGHALAAATLLDDESQVSIDHSL
jgi:hypothetical protein